MGRQAGGPLFIIFPFPPCLSALRTRKGGGGGKGKIVVSMRSPFSHHRTCTCKRSERKRAFVRLCHVARFFIGSPPPSPPVYNHLPILSLAASFFSISFPCIRKIVTRRLRNRRSRKGILPHMRRGAAERGEAEDIERLLDEWIGGNMEERNERSKKALESSFVRYCSLLPFSSSSSNFFFAKPWFPDAVTKGIFFFERLGNFHRRRRR